MVEPSSTFVESEPLLEARYEILITEITRAYPRAGLYHNNTSQTFLILMLLKRKFKYKNIMILYALVTH